MAARAWWVIIAWLVAWLALLCVCGWLALKLERRRGTRRTR